MVRTVRSNRPACAVFFLLTMALISSCKKPDEDLGLTLLPGDPLGAVVDSADLHAYVFVDSPVRTSGLSRNLLGSYVDPDFGLVRLGMVTQLRLTTNNVGQGQDNSGLQADSIVLALAFDVPNTHYGDLNAQLFQVFEITEDLSIDSVYKTDDVPQVIVDDLVASHAGYLTPNPYEQPTVGNDTLVPQLRIRLKNALAERFLNAFGTADLVDNAAFLQFFKGIHVTVDNPGQGAYQGGVLYLNTLTSASKVTVYYKDSQSSDPDQQRTFDLAINSNGVRYSIAEHDRTRALTPAVANALADPMAPAPTVYLQTLGGLRTAIDFPDILELAAGDRLLAKAELVIPVQGAYYPYYVPPTTMFIFRRGSDGEDVFLPDQLSSIAGIDGQFRVSAQEYRFNITRYIQGVVNGTIPNDGVVLVAGSTGVTANRVILRGPDSDTDPMYLELTFTTY